MADVRGTKRRRLRLHDRVRPDADRTEGRERRRSPAEAKRVFIDRSLGYGEREVENGFLVEVPNGRRYLADVLTEVNVERQREKAMEELEQKQKQLAQLKRDLGEE